MIKRLRVRNYKSLRNVDIPLRPLTVLVGPNAAGKSNILDCLAFLSELAQGSRLTRGSRERSPFMVRGGFTDIAWGGGGVDSNSRICIEFEGSIHFGRVEEPTEYTVVIGREEDGLIQEERALWGKAKTELFGREKFTRHDRRGTSGSIQGYEVALGIPSSGDEEAVALQQAVSSWSIYDFQRPRIALRQQVRKETRLATDGSNAARVLHWVRNEDVATFNRLESLLKTAIPEVEHLLAPPDEEGNVYIAFKEKHLPGRIPAWNLSEGSARLVATLLALFVPSPPALVAIEAPETSLHPRLMEYLADILKLGSRETQIIITTHSPYLLTCLPPESLLIVTKERGETRVKRVRRDRALTEALKVLGLGEMWYSGHLGGVP
jgi:predicted ATPase